MGTQEQGLPIALWQVHNLSYYSQPLPTHHSPIYPSSAWPSANMDHCSASTKQGQFRRGQGLYICLCQWLWEIDTRAQIEEDVTYNNFVLKKQTKAS